MKVPDLELRPDPSALSALRLADQLARSGKITPGHLALALLESDDGSLDQLLRHKFDDLRSSTIAACLRDILELTGHDAESQGAYDGPPAADRYSSACRESLARAGTRAGGRAIGRQDLIWAIFHQPDPALLEAFADAGLSAREVSDLAPELEPAARPAMLEPARELFVDGVLDSTRFDSVTRQALRRLSSLAQNLMPRKLRDVDLLTCLLQSEASRLAQALYVTGTSVRSTRQYLNALSPSVASTPSEPENGAVGVATVPRLRRESLNRFLEGIFKRAGELARGERSEVITESHLVRAHLDRTSGANHLYQRLGIDTVRLRRYLETYAAEPETPTVRGRLDIDAALRQRVLHQDHVIERVAPALRRLRTGLGEPGRPRGTFLFLGPTGVGKTELAKAMASVVFGDDPDRDLPLIKIDCGKLVESRDIVQLIGASQGLVGYKEGHLTNALHQRPESVVLFDEAEKAHPSIWQSLLTLFDEGILQEASGTEYDATRCVLVATSNRGYREALEHFDPFAAVDDEERQVAWEQVEQDVSGALKTYFSPELLGRFGRENIVFFRHFNAAQYSALVRLQIDRLRAEMSAHGIDVELDDAVIELLAAAAYARREEGARPVGRLITWHLRDQIVATCDLEPERVHFRFSALPGDERATLKQV